MSFANCSFQAFSVSGRFSVSRPTPPSCCHSIVS